MPTATLVPTALTDGSSNVAAGAYTDIDETIASADGVTLDSVTNKWTNYASGSTNSAFTFTMSDLPAAALSVNTVQFRVRARVTSDGGGVDDTVEYTCDVSGTNAPTTSPRWNDSDADAGFANRGASSGVTTSATVAEVNSWIVRVYQTLYILEGETYPGGDSLNFEIDAIEIIVDYNDTPPEPPAPGPTGTVYTVLPTTDTAIYGLCITQARDFVILGGLDTDRYSIRWSAIGDETDWPTPATDDARSKQSGSQQFPTKHGWVTGLAGDDFSMLVFQENAIWEANYVGGDIVWSFRLLSEDIGCVRQGRLLKVHDFVIFQSNNGYHVISQGQINNIGFGKVDDAYN